MGDRLSLISSRSLGSVGFPFEDGIFIRQKLLNLLFIQSCCSLKESASQDGCETLRPSNLQPEVLSVLGFSAPVHVSTWGVAAGTTSSNR